MSWLKEAFIQWMIYNVIALPFAGIFIYYIYFC